jgi:S-DNA-T family DNA segregation ATPase FtsK/SpoIIIE
MVSFVSFFDVEIEDALTMLSAKGPSTGIHNIIVVDKASGKSVPNGIKNNIPARIVFRTTSSAESRSIGVTGGEDLGVGEVICKPNFGGQMKLKAVYTPEVNVKETVEAVKQAGKQKNSNFSIYYSQR